MSLGRSDLRPQSQNRGACRNGATAGALGWVFDGSGHFRFQCSVQFSGRRDGDAAFPQAAPLCWWIPPEAGGTAGTASAQEFAHGTQRPFLPPVLRRSLDRLGQPRRGIGEHSRAEESTREAADRRAADSGHCGMRRHRGRVSLAPTGGRSRVVTCLSSLLNGADQSEATIAVRPGGVECLDLASQLSPRRSAQAARSGTTVAPSASASIRSARNCSALFRSAASSM